MYVLPFKSAFGCFKGVVVYLSCMWLFRCSLVSPVDLAFSADDYLATLFFGYLSLCVPSGVASTQIWTGQTI